MESQADFLNHPHQFSQRIFLLFQNAGRHIRLPERCKIVFEQAADSPQFSNGSQIGVGRNGSAEKTPPHVFGDGQTGNVRLLVEAHLFLRREADGEPDVCGIPAFSSRAFFAFHVFCL